MKINIMVNGKINATRTAIDEENGYYHIGQNIKNDFTDKRYLFDNDYNLIEINSHYLNCFTTVTGKIVVSSADVKNTFLCFRDDNENRYDNNIFVMCNDKEYVYILNCTRKDIKNNLPIITTPKLENSKLMFKPSLHECLNTFTVFKKMPIKFFCMMFNKCFNETLTEHEKARISKSNLNTGNFVEYAIEQDKRYLFDMEYNRIKKYDCIPNNQYIDFRDFEKLVNNTAKGIEVKTCFDSNVTKYLDYTARSNKTGGKSTGHGYIVTAIKDYFNSL